MIGTYGILLGGEEVGKAQVTQEGLYYCFCCKLKLSGDVMYKLVLQREGETMELGVPAPQGDVFTLTTRVPCKKVGDSSFSILAVPKHRPVGTKFIPLKEDEPFRYLNRLSDATYARVKGQPGLILWDNQEYHCNR